MFWINWILRKGSLNNILLNKETLLKICPNPGLNFKVFKKTISYSNKVQQTEKKNDIIKITDNNKIKTTQKQQERPPNQFIIRAATKMLRQSDHWINTHKNGIEFPILSWIHTSFPGTLRICAVKDMCVGILQNLSLKKLQFI